MLPIKNRLDLKKEMFSIQKNGKWTGGKFFSFLFQNQQSTDRFQPPTFAFIVSREVDKRATKRNRVKRLLSEIVRIFLPQIRFGVKGVFLVKKEILGKNFAEIKNEVEAIFKKEELLK